MLYSFMYELPKSNHKYGLSGIRLKVHAELHDSDFIHIHCPKFLVSNIKNQEEAHREIIIEARKHFEKKQREIQGERMLIEWFDNFGYTKTGSLLFMIAIVLMALIVHPLPGK